MSGVRVKTTEENKSVNDWTEGAKQSRKWGVTGTIIKQHNAHGPSFEVLHDDGTVGHYDPSEVMFLYEE